MNQPDDFEESALRFLYRLLAFLLICFWLAFIVHLSKPAAAQTYSSGIPFEWRIVDGDTISTISRPRRYFRLVGYDAPEISRPKCDSELILGEKAKRHLGDLLRGPGIVWFDPGEKDIYGRNLVHIWIKGTKVSDLMVRANLGVKSDGKGKFNWCKFLGG
jgi:endonuclease YncB( thermonuclease family)